MDGESYLNEISKTVKPVKPGKGAFLRAKWFKFVLVAVVAFVLIMIVGGVLGGIRDSVKNKTIELILRIDNVGKTVNDYKSSLKSSDLRSSSVSLTGILSDTSNKLTAYATENLQYVPSKVSKNLTEAETLHNDELSQALFNAKINGLLDRTFTHKMIYETALILNMESSLYDATSNAQLKEILSSSYDSLKVLYDNFNEFSEAK